MSVKKERVKKEKKEKVARVAGSPAPAIKWFQEQAANSQDASKVMSAAVKQGYSETTVKIQIQRLRQNGQLPPANEAVEPKEKKAKPRASMAKATKEETVGV